MSRNDNTDRDTAPRGEDFRAVDTGRPLHVHRADPARAVSFDDDADRWVAGGYQAAHQAYLDALGHVNVAPDGRDAAEGDAAEGDDAVPMTAQMYESALRELANPNPGPPDDPAEIAARIRELRARIHARAAEECSVAQRSDVVESDGEARGDDDRGWQR